MCTRIWPVSSGRKVRVSRSFCVVNSLTAAGSRERIPFFLAEGPPVDLIGSVQAIYLCEGIRPPVKKTSNHCHNCVYGFIVKFLDY